MKYIYALIIAFIMSSCSGAKQVINEQAIKEKNIEQEAPTDDLAHIKDTISTDDVSIETEVEEIPLQPKPGDIVEQIEVATSPISNAIDHIVWHDLLQKHVSDKGNVNYKGFAKDRDELTGYITDLKNKTPNDKWTREDKLAYWINAYNALTVDLILRNYPLKSIKDIKGPWDQRLWQLGAKWYTLNEIEHQILRKMNEPRIHFGIVCASYSCPKLLNEAFTASNLEVQLTKVTKEFLKDPERNNISEKSVKLSKIFKWFAKDFKTEGTLIDFLNKYSDISISKNAKKSFKDYNWALNE